MKILHLASFHGNIGDNASHVGFRNILQSLLLGEIVIDQLEIRRFYKKYSLPDKLNFNDDFVNLANKYDVLFIGGGGFLDFDIPGSINGTTIDISNSLLEKIKASIFISSVGCNPRNNIPEENYGRFKNFLDYFLSRKNSMIAVRNDGSKTVLKEAFGDEYYNAVPEVLDHGFFYTNDESLYAENEKKYILINTTTDQLDIMEKKAGINYTDNYIRGLSDLIDFIIHETELNIIFAPHIYSDYKAIDLLLSKVNDYYLRTRIGITPYAQGDDGCNKIFAAYKHSRLVLGMRFHANVCSMAMNLPCIGLAVLDRVKKVFENIGLGDQVVLIDDNFQKELLLKVRQQLSDNRPATKQYDLEGRKKDMIGFYSTSFEKLLNK